VYTEFLYDSREFRRQLRRHVAGGEFELVHADSLDLATFLPECGDLPVAVVHHDIESVLLQRRGDVEPSRARRAYLHYQARLMGRVERRWCPRVAVNVVTSDRDHRELQRRMPGIRVITVPNGVTIDPPAATATQDEGVAFIGGTTPFPNQDALAMFTEQVLPHLRALAPRGRITWIGRATSDQQTHYRRRYGIELTGYVDDVAPLVRAARCHIVPLRVGGGTRLKILTAWAAAKPVVSTSIGCEGLAANEGANILVRDDPAAFAAAIADVLEDAPLRRRLGDEGRATVERLYSWEAIGERMVDAYLTLAQARHEGRSHAASRECPVPMAG
jgi:glycosyltransferase involved in cell wall biosynthesis